VDDEELAEIRLEKTKVPITDGNAFEMFLFSTFEEKGKLLLFGKVLHGNSYLTICVHVLNTTFSVSFFPSGLQEDLIEEIHQIAHNCSCRIISTEIKKLSFCFGGDNIPEKQIGLSQHLVLIVIKPKFYPKEEIILFALELHLPFLNNF
jgi:hypothetical protein